MASVKISIPFSACSFWEALYSNMIIMGYTESICAFFIGLYYGAAVTETSENSIRPNTPGESLHIGMNIYFIREL